MIPEIKNFREKYPAYNDVDDVLLAKMLGKKYPKAYGDLVDKVNQGAGPKLDFVTPEQEGLYQGFIKPTLKAVPRVAGTAAGGLALMPGAGVASLLELLPKINPDPSQPLIMSGSAEQAGNVFEQVMGVPGSLIKTSEEAKGLENLGLVTKPLEMAGEGWRLIGKAANEGLKSLGLDDTYIEPLLQTYGEAAAIFGLPNLIKAIKGNIKFRTLTIKERGLVVQSLAETVKKNPGISEADLIRASQQYFKEARASRMVKPTPEPLSPAKAPIADQAIALQPTAVPKALPPGQGFTLPKKTPFLPVKSKTIRLPEGPITLAPAEKILADAAKTRMELPAKPKPKKPPVVPKKTEGALEGKAGEINKFNQSLEKATKLHKSSYGLKPKNSLQRLLEAKQILDDIGYPKDRELYTENERLIENYKKNLGITTPSPPGAAIEGEGMPKAEAKEPWEMSKDEFEARYSVFPNYPFDIKSKRGQRKQIEFVRSISSNKETIEIANEVLDMMDKNLFTHQENVQQALSEGKPVPPEVLKDYPDLKAKKPLLKSQKGQIEIDLQPIVDTIRKANGQYQKVKPHLQVLGQKAYRKAKDFKGWSEQMKSYLGDLWDTFKAKMREVWEGIKNLNKMLGERGAIGNLTPEEVLRKKLKKAEAELAEIKTSKEIIKRRRQKIRDIRDYFNLTDVELRQISRKDIRLMSNFEFKKFVDMLQVKAGKFDIKRQAKNQLEAHIREKELNVENLRKAMKLPTLKNMTIDNIRELDKALEPFQKGDVFLSVRKLETVDRTELRGIKTWREARERLAKKLNVPVKRLESIRVSEFDRFRYDTALAERNPFYRMMVEEPAKLMLNAQAKYLQIENEVFALAKKIKGAGKFVPQHKKIMTYLEAPENQRVALGLSVEEKALADYMIKKYLTARDYLIQIEAMNMGKENYFTHVRRGILEAVKEDGLIKAIKEQFEAYKLDEQAFNILDQQTGEIMAFDKFFKFAMHRTGRLKPTQNVVQAFLTYQKTFLKKQALDEIVPLIDIYAHALTPKGLTKKGLLLHGNLLRFTKEWLNTQKGRHVTLIAKQNGKIDGALRAIKMFTSLRDLGLNIPVSVATEIGEQVTTYQLLGKKNFARGKVRQNTKQGKMIIEKYRNLIGKNPWKELVEPAKRIGDRLNEGIFVLFRDASTRANKTFFLGSLSKAEFKAGQITPERLAALRTELGRYRMVEGMKSIIGATPEGKSYTQYKRWAIPILRTTIKNLGIVGKKITFQKPGTEAFRKSALELYRLVEVSAFALLMFGMIRDENDKSFIGKLTSKAYREATTLIQALQPKMFLAAGRTAAFVEELGVNLTLLLTGAQYKTGEFKGPRKLKRQLTPVAVSQFQNKKKKNLPLKFRGLSGLKGLEGL